MSGRKSVSIASSKLSAELRNSLSLALTNPLKAIIDPEDPGGVLKISKNSSLHPILAKLMEKLTSHSSYNFQCVASMRVMASAKPSLRKQHLMIAPQVTS
jgi:hypothetical protein